MILCLNFSNLPSILVPNAWSERDSLVCILCSRINNNMLGTSLVAPAINNLPANAGDTGSIPDLGGSHTPQSN